jgi:hypothetical protein
MLVYFGGRSFILKKIPVFFSLIILMAGDFNKNKSVSTTSERGSGRNPEACNHQKCEV